jgi:aspartyl-tRNA(Asn)/glutamyl-tRNA(Gln) amidotransferase subunit C
MALTIEEVRKIASLARLRFAAEEEALFGGQLDRIVAYIDQLGRYTAVPSAAKPVVSGQEADRAEPCLPRDTFLANAPASMDGFLLVPEIKGGADHE